MTTLRISLRDPLFVRWLVLFYVLNLSDLVTTWIGFRYGAVEAIPVNAYLYGHFPFVVGAIWKLGIISLLMGYVATIQYRWWRLAALIEMGVFCGAMVVVNVLNIHAILVTR